MTHPPPQRQFVVHDPFTPVRVQAAAHPIYRAVPSSVESIRWYDVPRWVTWNLFGNDDDGIFGERQEVPYSTNISSATFLRWTGRNPFHNCFFYTIGSAGWTNHHGFALLDISSGERPHFFSQDAGRISGEGRFGMRLAFHDYKPFFSLNLPYLPGRRFEFYFGWRERGNFGIKLKPWVKK